jgi:hypothetical protein
LFVALDIGRVIFIRRVGGRDSDNGDPAGDSTAAGDSAAAGDGDSTDGEPAGDGDSAAGDAADGVPVCGVPQATRIRAAMISSEHSRSAREAKRNMTSVLLDETNT